MDVSSVVRFFFSKDQKVSSKITALVFILGALLLIDNILGFSFHYETNQKLNQIEKVQELKEKYKDQPKAIEHLNSLEKELFARKNAISSFLELFSNKKLTWINP